MNAREIIEKWLAKLDTPGILYSCDRAELKKDLGDAYHSILTEYVPTMTKLCMGDWEFIRAVIDCIFMIYPQAYVYQMPTTWKQVKEDDPGGILLGFRALGGDGSDDVHIQPDGSWYQWMSGDLDLNRLDMLERLVKALKEAHEGPDKDKPLIFPRCILFPKTKEGQEEA